MALALNNLKRVDMPLNKETSQAKDLSALRGKMNNGLQDKFACTFKRIGIFLNESKNSVQPC